MKLPKYVLYLPVLPLSTLVMMGVLRTTEYRFGMANANKTGYALAFGVVAYLVSTLSTTKPAVDSMLVKKVISFAIGLAIIGALHYGDHAYEPSNAWGSLVASLVYIYLLVFGFDTTLTVNPLFFVD
jgi:hypothetical protein